MKHLYRTALLCSLAASSLHASDETVNATIQQKTVVVEYRPWQAPKIVRKTWKRVRTYTEPHDKWVSPLLAMTAGYGLRHLITQPGTVGNKVLGGIGVAFTASFAHRLATAKQKYACLLGNMIVGLFAHKYRVATHVSNVITAAVESFRAKLFPRK